MFEQTFKNIDDVLWKEAGCSSELDYTEQTSWLLFLKYEMPHDAKEQLGEMKEIRDLFIGFQKYLYEKAMVA